jgi:RNA polymerase sigma-70 factor (ECF subfamily)
VKAADAPAAHVDRIEGPSDEELLGACAQGDDTAFTHLLQRHRDRIVQLVRWHLGPRDPWAEDLAQDVFLQVHRKAGSFEGRSSFKTWLYAVALNLCRDHARRQRRTVRLAAQDEEVDAIATIPDASLGPFEQLDRAEQIARLRAAVDRLSLTYRTILQLRDWEDMSYDEIAQVLGVPVGTVRSRLHNARVALARELTEERR